MHFFVMKQPYYVCNILTLYQQAVIFYSLFYAENAIKLQLAVSITVGVT